MRPVTTVIWVFRFPPRTYILPLYHISQFDAALLHSLISPNYPGIRETVHMYVSFTRQPPPLVSVLSYLSVLDLLPRSLLAPEFPLRMPVFSVYLVRSPPLCSP